MLVFIFKNKFMSLIMSIGMLTVSIKGSILNIAGKDFDLGEDLHAQESIANRTIEKFLISKHFCYNILSIEAIGFGQFEIKFNRPLGVGCILSPWKDKKRFKRTNKQ